MCDRCRGRPRPVYRRGDRGDRRHTHSRRSQGPGQLVLRRRAPRPRAARASRAAPRRTSTTAWSARAAKRDRSTPPPAITSDRSAALDRDPLQQPQRRGLARSPGRAVTKPRRRQVSMNVMATSIRLRPSSYPVSTPAHLDVTHPGAVCERCRDAGGGAAGVLVDVPHRQIRHPQPAHVASQHAQLAGRSPVPGGGQAHHVGPVAGLQGDSQVLEESGCAVLVGLDARGGPGWGQDGGLRPAEHQVRRAAGEQAQRKAARPPRRAAGPATLDRPVVLSQVGRHRSRAWRTRASTWTPTLGLAACAIWPLPM